MRLERLIKLVKNRAGNKDIQIFFNSCLDEDKEKLDFEDSDIEVYYHPKYEYFEILGLSTSAQRRLDSMLDNMKFLKN